MGWGGGKGRVDPWMMMKALMMFSGKGKGKGKSKGKQRSQLTKYEDDKKVWVGNLAESVTWKELQAHFSSIGTCKYAVVFKGKGKGTGGVAFAEASEASSAIKMLKGSTLGGQRIEVDSWVKLEKPAK